MKRLLLIAVLFVLAAPVLMMATAPRPGWVTTARVVSVYDGDTVVVEVTKRLRVRLIDTWAPEIRTRDLEAKRRGIAARDYLRGIIKPGQEVTLEIPTASNGDIGKSFTFSRVLGRIYAGGDDVSKTMIEAGHATKDKQK